MAVDSENPIADLQRKVANAFDVFDHEGNKTVDIREIGTIVRSLNCCPSEGELNDILVEVEDEEPTGFVHYEKFEPTMIRILLEKKYPAAPEKQLLKAFEVLDEEVLGHLETSDLEAHMTGQGEPFSKEEMEEMLSAAVDPDRGVILYKDYVSLMTVDNSTS